MKRILLAVLAMTYASQSFSQDDTNISEIKIDPRQYVTVQYKKTPTQGKLDTIWNWENRKNIPNQKINFIDVDGEIKIDFSKIGLIENKDFEGTVSLEAEISGVNGTRKIEVNPYSEIGIQRIPIGIKSEPPQEIVKKLLNMIIELKDIESQFTFNNIYASFTKEDVIRRREILVKKHEIDSLINLPKKKITDIIPYAILLRKLCQNQLNSFFFDAKDEYPNKIDSSFYSSKTKEELKGNIHIMIKNYEQQYNDDRDNYIKRFIDVSKTTSLKLDMIISYLNAFESSGEDAMKALLGLINKDLINYTALKNDLLESKKEISPISFKNLEQDSLANILLNRAEDINYAMSKLVKYSRFKGSLLEKEITSIMQRRSLPFTKSDTSRFTEEKQKEDFYFSIIENYFDEISENLSLIAGKVIYKKLVYGSIDLGKSGAKNGEVLNVYLTWILDSKRDSLANSPRLPIGKYYLRETGWRMEISDMFALIKRLNEAKVNQATVSPSNFKGSGGAVLMWTFNKEDKGLIITDKGNSNFSAKKRNRFVNFLEPSFGLNISYLDFSTEKDVEIGTGLQLGLFKNKIFFGYGVNLHMLSPKNQSPTYFYVGFSFAKLSDLFKSSNNVTSVQ